MRYFYAWWDATGYAGSFPLEQRGVNNTGPRFNTPPQDTNSLLLCLQSLELATGENNVRAAEQRPFGVGVDAPEAGPVQYMNRARPDNGGYQAAADGPFGNEEGRDDEQDVDCFVTKRRNILGHAVDRRYSQRVDRLHCALLVASLRNVAGAFRRLKLFVEMFEDVSDKGVIDYYSSICNSGEVEHVEFEEDRAENNEEYDPAAPDEQYGPHTPGEGYSLAAADNGYASDAESTRLTVSTISVVL